MRSGFTTQQVRAATVSRANGHTLVHPEDAPDRPALPTDGGILRDNLRHRRQLLDAIFTAAKKGDEAETLRLAAKLGTLRHYSEQLHTIHRPAA